MTTKRPSELDVQDRVADAIWFVPASDDAQAHYVLEYSGRGPKAYLNLWLGKDYGEELTTWNWVLYESAVELWRRDSTDEEIIDVLLPVNDLTRERDELRAEVERLRMQHENLSRECLGQYELMSAEVERLKSAVTDLGVLHITTHTENERLRAALSEITDLELEGDASLGDAIVIADEALNPPPDDLCQ